MTEDQLIAELAALNARPATHYYVILTDEDTGLTARIDQTHQVNLAGSRASMAVLRTKLIMMDGLKTGKVRQRMQLAHLSADVVIDSGSVPDPDRSIEQAVRELTARMRREPHGQ